MTGNFSRRLFIQTALGGALLRGTGAVAGSHPIERAATDETLAEPAPSGAVTTRIGALRDGDPVHRGSGTALLLKLPDGSNLVRLENLDVVRGPSLFVYLVAHEDPLFPEDVTAGFRDLGALKSRFGDQNYPVPDNVDVTAYGSIVVWCDTFKVQFAVAALE